MGDQTQNEDFTKDTESDETVVVIDGTDETALPDAVLWGGILELGFGLAPTKVMRDTRLSRTARLLYVHYTTYANQNHESFPAVTTLMRYLNACEETYYKAYHQLIDYGYIYVEKQERCNKNGGKYYRNVYHLVQDVKDPPCLKAELDKARGRRAEQEQARKEAEKPTPKKQGMVQTKVRESQKGQKPPPEKLGMVDENHPQKNRGTPPPEKLGVKNIQYNNNTISSLSHASLPSDDEIQRKQREKIEREEIKGKVSKCLELSGKPRAVKPGDIALYKVWSKSFGFTDEMIFKAAEMAVVADHTTAYISKVLQDWRAKGIFDLSSVPEKKERATEAAAKRPPDTFDRFEHHDYPEGYFDNLYDDPFSWGKQKDTGQESK
jgi:DnaD/phage-associated family protein